MIIIVYILRYVKVGCLQSKEQFDEKSDTVGTHMTSHKWRKDGVGTHTISHEWRKDGYCYYDKQNIYIGGDRKMFERMTSR